MSRRWRRILIGFGITVVVLCVYAWSFGFQTLMMLEARQVGRRFPVVWQTPQPLSDTSIATSHGPTLSYFDYQFGLPWNDLDESATKATANRVVLRFRSGRTLILSSLPPREFVKGILEQSSAAGLRQLYGDQFLQSDYAMWSMIANTTPGKLNLLSSRKEAAGIPILLLLKAIASPEESGIYTLQTKKHKGFQWGNPEGRPRHVVADLYADDGGLEFIFIGSGKGQPLGITQAEINCVLQSVHKIAE